MSHTRTIVTASVAGLLLTGAALAPRPTTTRATVTVVPAYAVPAADPPPVPPVVAEPLAVAAPAPPSSATPPETTPPAPVVEHVDPPARPVSAPVAATPVAPPPTPPGAHGYCSRVDASKVKAVCFPADRPTPTVTSSDSTEPVFLVDETGGYCYATGAAEAAAAGEPDGSPRCAGSTSGHPVTPTHN